SLPTTAAAAAPANVAASRVANGVRVSWSPTEGAVSYTIARGTSPGSEVAIASGIIATTYLDTTADPNTTYYYVVTAVGDASDTADSSAVASPPRVLHAAADFDGDGRTDLAVFRRPNGSWYIAYAATNFTTSTTVQWGLPGDVPVAGDYEGNGITEP